MSFLYLPSSINTKKLARIISFVTYVLLIITSERHKALSQVNLKCEMTNRQHFGNKMRILCKMCNAWINQQLLSIDGSTYTDPDLMPIKLNDLINVQRLIQHLHTG